jgi:hypothetical protein
MLLLSLVSFGIALISDSLWAVTASTVRSWFAGNPRRLATVGGAGGLAMRGTRCPLRASNWYLEACHAVAA